MPAVVSAHCRSSIKTSLLFELDACRGRPCTQFTQPQRNDVLEPTLELLSRFSSRRSLPLWRPYLRF